MRPGLTLLCITKDQAPKLMRMLQSVQGVVDDMVVCDTGSKDLSPGVARMQGARVFEVGWPGSFSDALNVGMKEIQTEWTLRLDTDEWLVTGAGTSIRSLIERDEAFGYYLIRRDLSDEEHYSEGWHFRLWRSDPRLRFQGFIHEHFSDDLVDRVAGKRHVFRVPVSFWHDGFVGGSNETKYRRNIELLKRELEARPGQLYYEAELAQTRLLLGDASANEDIRRIADELIDGSFTERPEPYLANILGVALAGVQRRDLDTVRTQRLIDRAWEWFDASPPMLWSVAQTELRRKDLQGLFRALLRLEELSDSGEYEREWTFDGQILGEKLWEALASVASTLGATEVMARNRARLQK